MTLSAWRYFRLVSLKTRQRSSYPALLFNYNVTLNKQTQTKRTHVSSSPIYVCCLHVAQAVWLGAVQQQHVGLHNRKGDVTAVVHLIHGVNSIDLKSVSSRCHYNHYPIITKVNLSCNIQIFTDRKTHERLTCTVGRYLGFGAQILIISVAIFRS